MVATRHQCVPPSTPTDNSGRPTTTSAVSLPLVDIVEALAHHVPPERRPQVQLLARLAREKPEQEQKVKEQLLIIGGADALRAAVCSLLGAQSKASAAAPASAVAPAIPAHGPAPIEAPLGLAPLQAVPCDEPPMPPNMQAIFGSTQSTEEFKASLVHAFHCHTPSCPVAGCSMLTAKLSRLQQHVSSCSEGACLLCRIWTYLKYYHDAGDPFGSGSLCQVASAPAASHSLAQAALSNMLLPRLQPDGSVSWVSPHEALAHVTALTSGSSGGGGNDPPSKRQSLGDANASCMAAASAGSMGGVLHGDLASLQGVLPDSAGAASLPMAAAPPSLMPRVVPSASSSQAPPLALPQASASLAPPLPAFDFEHPESVGDVLGSSPLLGGRSPLLGGGGAPAPADAPGHAPSVRMRGARGNKRTLTTEQTRTSSTLARSSSGLHVPLLKPVSAGMGSMGEMQNLPGSGLGGAFVGGLTQFPAELRMEGLAMAGSKSFNLSGNLADLLRSSSNLDLGLYGLGLSASDLGGIAAEKADAPSSAELGAVGAGTSLDARRLARGASCGLSFSRMKSGLGDKCASELSLSGFLNESELGTTQSQGSSSASGGSIPVDNSLREIMNDFSCGSHGPAERLVSA